MRSAEKPRNQHIENSLNSHNEINFRHSASIQALLGKILRFRGQSICPRDDSLYLS